MARGMTVLLAFGDVVMWAHLEGRRAPRIRAMSAVPVDHLDPEGGAIERIEVAARACPDLGRDTYVLSDEVFAITLGFDARSIRGLSDADTRNALALEAQMHSGISAEDAALAWAPLSATGATRRFSVQQVTRDDLSELELRLREHGGHLKGIAHPAGLPASLAGDSAAFVRDERWSDVSVRVERESHAADVEVEYQRGSPLTPGAFPRATVTETLHSRATVISDALPAATLADEATLRRWIESWATVLAAGTLPIIVRPPKPPVSAAQRAAISISIAALVLLGCYLDYSRMTRQLADVGKELVNARVPIDTVTRTRTESSRLRAELAAITAPAPQGTPTPRSGWRSDTAARLLEATAKRRPRGVMIDGVSIGWTGGAISGCSIERTAVDDFGDSIASHFAESNLLIVPTSRRLIETGDRAGLFEFTLQVEVRQEATPAASSSENRTAEVDNGADDEES